VASDGKDCVKRALLFVLAASALIVGPQPSPMRENVTAEEINRANGGTMTKKWSFSGLSLELPQEFVQTKKETTKHNSPFIPGEKTEEAFCEWQGGNDRYVRAFVWTPYPWRDGGPLVAARTWDKVVAGEKTELIETK
jgi:hypothetical protein